MPKLKKRIVRNEETFKLEWKKVRLSFEVPEYVRDEFKKAVEKNGKTMTHVLTEYMKRYVRKQRELERNRQKRALASSKQEQAELLDE